MSLAEPSLCPLLGESETPVRVRRGGVCACAMLWLVNCCKFSVPVERVRNVLVCLCVIGKPRGLRTARKLRVHRRDQRWHDKSYKKANLGTALKANPFGGASHAKGIVLEKV